MKIAFLLLLFFTALNLATAQVPPKAPAPAKAPTLSDDARKNIVIDYQTALLAQQSVQAAQQQAQTSAQSFLATCEREMKAAGFPDGTQCQVDVNAKKVTPVPPAPPAPAEPAKAKASEPKPGETPAKK
jgi:hypothetical protein